MRCTSMCSFLFVHFPRYYPALKIKNLLQVGEQFGTRLFQIYSPLVIPTTNLLIQFREAVLQGNGAVVLKEAMCAMGGADYLASASHCISKTDFHPFDFGDGDFDINHVFERGWFSVLALYFDDGRDNAFLLHPIEAVADLVHPVHAGFFHQTDIIGMMGDTHPVALIVFDLVLIRSHGI